MSSAAPLAAGSRAARLLAVLVAAPLCAAVSLRAGAAQPGAFSEPPFGCCDAISKPVDKEKVGAVKVPQKEAKYLVEWVSGYDEKTGGIAHSRYHHEVVIGNHASVDGSKCLTAGKEDRAGGYALGWSLCRGGVQGDKFGSKPKDGVISDAGEAVIAAQRRAAQEWTLTKDGKLKSSGGLCVRRMHAVNDCDHGEGGNFYDLGHCDGPGMVASFVVSRVMRNDMNQLALSGYPAQTVKTEMCTMCGPYVLQERCLSGGGPTVGAPGCPPDYHAKAGWSKLPSTYVGDAAVEGRAAIDQAVHAKDMFTFSSKEQDNVQMSGLGATSDVGLCGSYVTDGPYLDSTVYLHKVTT